MMRWSLALLFTGVAGLLVQTQLSAGDKKAAGGDLNVKGELTDKDDKDKIRTSSYCKIYTLKMVKGHTYLIDMKSKDIDSYLRLENPDGKQVAADDDSGGFPDVRIVYKAADSGNFKIIATTFGGNSTGAFTLTAVDKDSPAAGNELKLDKGEGSLAGKLSKDDPLYKNKRHKLIFVALEAGKTYQIDMKSKDLDSYLFLESPDGELLAQDDDGGGFPDARIVHKAAKAGRYRIICTYFGGGGAGDFSLTVKATE